LIFSRKHVAAGIAALAIAGAVALLDRAQSQSAPAINRPVVVLDPAHGGPDAGAKLGDQLLEKDVTLALAARLRATLTAAGFTVVSTRDADSFNPLTTDQRAETANRAHAVACLVIHATKSGSGVHLYASALESKDPPAAGDDFEPTPWDSAQAESVKQSLHLESDLGAALGSANVPVTMGRAAVRPLDNMMCPAVAVEVAPLGAGDDATAVTDPGYQQRLAEAVAKALQSWRGHADVGGAQGAGAAVVAKTPVPADQAGAAAKATAAAEAAGRAAAKAHGNGGTQ
jgi:N-acetylmuramoyl-L-alanine amidase